MIKYLWKEEWPWGGPPFLASAPSLEDLKQEMQARVNGDNKIVSPVLKLDWTGEYPVISVVHEGVYHVEKTESLYRGPD